MLPRSLQIELCYNLAGIPHCRGGFADVWKGEYHGLEVAAKVLRIYATSDLQKITRVSHSVAPPSHVFVDMLTVTPAEVLQGVRNVEGSSASQRVAATRGHNVRNPIRDGIGVDDERKHQPICSGTPGCESVRTCTFPFGILPSSLSVDGYVTSAAGRRRERFGLHARSGNGSWGSKGGMSPRTGIRTIL